MGKENEPGRERVAIESIFCTARTCTTNGRNVKSIRETRNWTLAAKHVATRQ